jgi:hypothetical protein
MVAEQVVLGWLTLELTDSPLLVGVALGARMAPLVVAGIPAGLVGLWSLLLLLLLTLAAGAVRALQQTAQQTYAVDLAGPARLVDALAVIGLAMRAGGLAGSLRPPLPAAPPPLTGG